LKKFKKLLKMSMKEVSKGVYYVGVDDHQTALFENLWPLPMGVSYNSYLIIDEKTALIDGVESHEVDSLLSNIQSVKEGASLDYLIVNHMEPDHSGAIPTLSERFPEMQIICNRQTVGMIKGFYPEVPEERFIVVKDGEELSLGDIKLKFVLTPMVHWPETMMTMIEDRGILFAGDAFGGFGALNGNLFDDEADIKPYVEEIYRYYANIVGKYGRFVQNAFGKLAGYDIKMICPTHGLVWRKDLSVILGIYDKLSKYEGEEGVTVAYSSMYGNTRKQAEYIAEQLSNRGIKNVRLYKVGFDNLSYVISDAFRYKGLVVGCPTYSMELFPPIEALMRALKVRELKNRAFGAFTSYAWAPKTTMKRFEEYADDMNMPLVGKSEMKQALIDESKASLDELIEAIAKGVKGE
jgi:flavorubredoxin